jgi:hypothetical protein
MKLSPQQRDALRRVARGEGQQVPAPILRSLDRRGLVIATPRPVLTDKGQKEI